MKTQTIFPYVVVSKRLYERRYFINSIVKAIKAFQYAFVIDNKMDSLFWISLYVGYYEIILIDLGEFGRNQAIFWRIALLNGIKKDEKILSTS